MQPLTLLLGGIAALGVLLFFNGIVASRRAATPSFEDEYLPASAQAPTSPREAFGGAMDAFNRLLTSRPRTSKVADNLAKADLKLRVSEYAILVAVAMVGAFMLSFLVNKNFIVSLLFGVLGYFAPGLYVRFRQGRRAKALNSQLGDTILLLSNALKAGYSFAQAMATVAKAAPQPMSDEFNRAVREMNLGITVDEALEHMNVRISSEDFDLMVTAVQIHRVVGGNLAEILDTIAFTIRERIRIQGEIRTLTAQARASGYIIIGLPFALVLILIGVSPAYMLPLFGEVLGWVMITVALIMMGVGYALIRRISNIEV
jgi:tight adherence protein B